MALHPALVEFVDLVSMAPELRVEELVVGTDSALVSRTVRQICSPYDGVMILAVRNTVGELLVPPRADTVLQPGDLMIAVGPAAALVDLAATASTR